MKNKYTRPDLEFYYIVCKDVMTASNDGSNFTTDWVDPIVN